MSRDVKICTPETPYDWLPRENTRWSHPSAKCTSEEYNGLAGGGDYEHYECPVCKFTFYVELPD